jgi:aminoglycoside/choline kinase family phosphotransferase
MSETDQRQREAASWAARTMGVESVRLTPVSGDASFRRYFRFFMGRRSIILMDAPPEKEDSAPFVEIAGRLRCAGLKAPEILYFNLERGFGLLEDFGDTLYRELISEESVDKLFPELFGVLHDMACGVDTRGLPTYSESALSRDLELFRNWYLDVHRKTAPGFRPQGLSLLQPVTDAGRARHHRFPGRCQGAGQLRLRIADLGPLHPLAARPD